MPQRATHWPAAVSERSVALLSGPPVPARVLTVVTSALYLAVHGEGPDARERVLPLVARGGLRLPTALTLGFEVPVAAWGVGPGSAVLLGGGTVRLPEAVVRGVRTWSPPRVPSPDAATGREAAALAAALPSIPSSALRDRAHALAADLLRGGNPTTGVHALVGAGPGLTPSGDDALCGVLLALRLLGPQTSPLRVRLWAAVQARLRATTSLSASLLAEAEQGYAVPPLVRLCGALVAGEEQEAAAHAQMVAAIGHSSGRDLLAGLAGGLAGALESGLEGRLEGGLESDLQRGATDLVRSIR